jgi:hypothetical protein
VNYWLFKGFPCVVFLLIVFFWKAKYEKYINFASTWKIQDEIKRFERRPFVGKLVATGY